MRLRRAHGLGNDYLVLEEGPDLTPALARAVCDRHRGVGGDGILELFSTTEADYGVRIWNPDGSVAEKSGNGLRIFARWLRDEGAPEAFSVWTGSERVTCTVTDHGVTVQMGTARFTPEAVPFRGDLGALQVDGERLVGIGVGVGNPHCVIFREEADLDGLPWRRWGAALETDRRFPNRTNVQIARIVGDEVEIRIWERGAGETLASGSSSCAAAAAAVHIGRLAAGRITVRMPGGTLWVTVGEDFALTLEGPVEVVGRIEVDPRWLRAHHAQP